MKTAEAPKSIATWRSARLARPSSTSVGRQVWAGEAGVRRSGRGPSQGRWWVVVVVAHAESPCWVTGVRPGVLGLRLGAAGGVGGDPDREADQPTDADEPGEEALAHRAEAAEAEPAVAGRLAGVHEVGDDVALLVGRQAAVGERRHRLRAGQERLVDVLGARRRAGWGRTHRAASRHPGRRSCGRRCSWSGRSGHRGRSRPPCRRPCRPRWSRAASSPSRSGMAGPVPRESTYAREQADLLVGVDGRLADGLLARLGHRHPAGADLEVDRGGADVGQGGAVLGAVVGEDALAVLAVAERAADEEELASRP